MEHRSSLPPLRLVCNVLLTYCCSLVWVKSVIGEPQEEAVDGKMGIIRFRSVWVTTSPATGRHMGWARFYYGFKFPFVLFPQPAVEHEPAYQNLWLAVFVLIDFVIHLHYT